MFTHPFHVFDNHNAFLSEGGALTVVVRDFPKRRMGRGITRISHVPCEKAKRGGASRVPPSPGATARRTRGVLVEGATPLF